MEKHCRPRKSRLSWVSIHKASSLELISEVQKRITRLQKNRVPPYSVTVFETRGGVHAHIVFIADCAGVIADTLSRSKKFGHLTKVEHVYDAQGLRKYLSKERTPEAGYGREYMFGGRLKGSHRLPGGGDRVRLSRELERDAIEARYVEPWPHSNARRAKYRKDYRPRQLKHRAPWLAGQIPLLPEFDRPVSRLRQFGGGFVPPSVALEIEHHRHRHGLSQREIAARIGVSQGQYANACRGHDPLSAFAVNRLRDVLRSQVI
jgi:hypothetical protein